MDVAAIIVAALLCIFTGNARADVELTDGQQTEQHVEPTPAPRQMHIGAAAFQQNMICGAFMGATDYRQKVQIIRAYGRDAVARCFY